MKWALLIATGPSLRRADIDALRGRVSPVVAVNCAVFYAPWADTLYAGDGTWWNEYGPKVEWYRGERLSRTGNKFGAQRCRTTGWGRSGGNSGHQALQILVDRGHEHIALLGFDHQHTGGKAHCHADHPQGMGNAQPVHNWRQQMVATARDIERRGVKVLNLSRETGLDCFERVSVEDFIDRYIASP